MNRPAALEDLYQGLGCMVRRSRDLSAELHPRLSLVAYTLLTHIASTPKARAADLAAYFGLDKSTVSRQLDELINDGLLRRAGEQPGRRGLTLVVTAEGHRELRAAADCVRARLAEWLADWDDQDLAVFARLVTKFNHSTQAC
jgi:DNA-binding MarR family transcriptional regulator